MFSLERAGHARGARLLHLSVPYEGYDPPLRSNRVGLQCTVLVLETLSGSAIAYANERRTDFKRSHVSDRKWTLFGHCDGQALQKKTGDDRVTIIAGRYS